MECANLAVSEFRFLLYGPKTGSSLWMLKLYTAFQFDTSIVQIAKFEL